MPRVALAKRVRANAVDNLLASTEVFPMTAPAPKGRLGNGQLRRHKDAVRDRRPFSPRTGLPEAEATVGEDPVTWYKQARASTEVKWASLAPASRRPVAEALVTVTVASHREERGAPEGKVLRQALFAWAFNSATRDQVPPPETAAALDRAERTSLPVSALENPAAVRLALGACARTLTGKAAAGSTQRRKRSVFYNALSYAIELGHLASNPDLRLLHRRAGRRRQQAHHRCPRHPRRRDRPRRRRERRQRAGILKRQVRGKKPGTTVGIPLTPSPSVPVRGPHGPRNQGCTDI